MRIAICDDEQFFRKELRKQLDNYAKEYAFDFVYTEFSSGQLLLESSIDFDLIFMDYQMNIINGNVKIMFKANFIGTLSDELQCFIIAVPTYPVKVIRTNGDVIMYAICINVSADDYWSVYSEYLFRPFHSYPMRFFGRNGAVKGLRV